VAWCMSVRRRESGNEVASALRLAFKSIESGLSVIQVGKCGSERLARLEVVCWRIPNGVAQRHPVSHSFFGGACTFFDCSGSPPRVMSVAYRHRF
jgi:hypothetical protein